MKTHHIRDLYSTSFRGRLHQKKKIKSVFAVLISYLSTQEDVLLTSPSISLHHSHHIFFLSLYNVVFSSNFNNVASASDT